MDTNVILGIIIAIIIIVALLLLLSVAIKANRSRREVNPVSPEEVEPDPGEQTSPEEEKKQEKNIFRQNT